LADVNTILLSAVVGGVVGFFGNIVMQNRTRWLEIRTYSKALAREMELIARKLNEYSKFLERYDEHINTLAASHLEVTRRSVSAFKVPRLPMVNDDLIIFNSDAAKIGLLDEPFAMSTLKFYRDVRDLKLEASTHWEGKEPQWQDFARGRIALKWKEDLCNHLQRTQEVSVYGRDLSRKIEGTTKMSPYRRRWLAFWNWFRQQEE
jgi:hypothetical protein